MAVLTLIIKSINQKKRCSLPTVCQELHRMHLWSNQYNIIDLKCMNLSAVDTCTYNNLKC